MARMEGMEGTGVVATRDELVGLAKLVGATRSTQGRRVATPRVGSHVSRFHGPGMDFAETREYQHGDDIRAIDWRITARTGRAHTKLFEAERERPAWFLADLGPSMRFATRGVLKSVAAARATSLLAWQAHREGEPIGGIVRSSGHAFEESAGRSRRHLMRLIDALAKGTEVSPDADAKTSLSDELEWVRGRARSGSRVIVVSDFYGLESGAENEAYKIMCSLVRRCELTLVWVYDRMEAKAPPPGRYRVSDGEHCETLVSRRSHDWRQRYHQDFDRRGSMLNQLVHSFGAKLLPLRTDEPTASVLDPMHARASALEMN